MKMTPHDAFVCKYRVTVKHKTSNLPSSSQSRIYFQRFLGSFRGEKACNLKRPSNNLESLMNFPEFPVFVHREAVPDDTEDTSHMSS